MKLNKNHIIEKRNVLNELRAKNMTLQELRFLNIYLSKINARDISSRKVRFALDDFRKILDLGKLNIQYLKTTTDSLLCKIVHIPKENGGYTAFQLFKKCVLDQDELGSWYVEIDAHDEALPLMFEFKEKYFKYNLNNILALSSKNQLRMYEILKQHEHQVIWEVSIENLRELLGLDKKEYVAFKDFKRYILVACQGYLQKNTDILYTFKKGKTGSSGKWLSIIFHITRNTTVKIEDIEAEKNTYTYTNEQINLLSSLCNHEFSNNQISVIESKIRLIEGIDAPNYLKKKYQELNLRAEKSEIKSRFNYLIKLVELDVENNKKNKNDQPSYDLEDYERFSINYLENKI